MAGIDVNDQTLSGPLARYSGAMRLACHADAARMGAAAARDIAAAIRRRLETADGVRMVFAAAPSQATMLAALLREPGIDWSRVTAFHMDEYIGLADDAPQRFAAWLRRHLFDLKPFGAVHLMHPGDDPAAEAARYAGLMAQQPVDVVCLGIGVNGHLAFNDPPVADFSDPHAVKIVELDHTCRQQQVDDGCFAALGDVPRTALTLTIPRLLDADRLFCVVPGSAKRRAVTQALFGPVSTQCPASILRDRGNVTLYLDEGSRPDDTLRDA